ncbi:MAG: hypothetical protein EZS28_023833 [Streblomastix strix]|uniref:Uncharacterized protein n=1 Tax=Streblomastix strix TaxID=222440 RepID=A0A5J4VDW1_9EUKA|nr:MAG: hypothetical protein EZS28_023833 [Streblomastix strix]
MYICQVIKLRLERYQQYLRRYWTPPILLPITIPDAVIECYNKLWYYQYRDCQLQGTDIYGCGWSDYQCRTFEFGLQEVSWRICGYETALIENKTIMTSNDTNGYDQDKTIELNQKERRCQNLRILKVLFGDSHAITQQADIQIFKGISTTLEDNNKGFIRILNDMNLSLQGITLTADRSIFIPAIYISDQNTTVKLEEFIIYDITFQPQIPYSTGPRGVVQIDFSVKDVQILNCQFENIIIDSLEGIELRIQNFTDTPPIIPPLILPLPHPEPDTSINITINSTSAKDIQSSGNISNHGGASIYGEIGDNGSLIIEDASFASCCYIENDGGCIYVILNKTFRFETKGTVIFTGCRTTKDTLEVVRDRSGALYIYLAEESTYNFIIGEDSQFTTNAADICGEYIFIYSRNINILNI